jgi:AcrR family transcriptional regulator
VDSGYRGTTFVEVCRRAGLTRGAAHHHYRDLPALMLDAMARLNERLVENARPLVRNVDEIEKRVDAAIDVLWDLFTQRDFKAAVEIWVAQSHDPLLRDRLHSEMDRYSRTITQGFGRTFPELMGDGEDALLMMRFGFLVMLGLGFVNATFGPREEDPGRVRMLAMLKRVLQREVAAIQEKASSSSAA